MTKRMEICRIILLLTFILNSHTYGGFWASKRCADNFISDYNRVISENQTLLMYFDVFEEVDDEPQIREPLRKHIVETVDKISTQSKIVRSLATQFRDKYLGLVCKSTVTKPDRLDPVEVTINVNEKMSAILSQMEKVFEFVNSVDTTGNSKKSQSSK